MRPQYTPHPSRRAQERAPQDEDASHVVTETTPLDFLFVLAVGLLAGTISGIVGTGSSIMLMPMLVYQYGPKQAGPIIAAPAPFCQPSRTLSWGPAGGTRARAPPSLNRISP